eukprot:jgi/Tetstr1/421793/TSEL_012696.t1
MAVPAPPMSRATSSQHPATTASATADGAPPAGHADLLVAMLTGALRAVAGGGHMHYHVRVMAGRPSCVDCGQRTDWECCCDGTPALDAFHDATRAAVCEASEKARAAGRVRRVRRRTAQELKESETCRQ